MVVGEWSVALGGRGKAALPASQVGGGYGSLLVVRGLYISRKRSVVCVLIVGLFHCPVDCVCFFLGGGLKTWVNFWLRYWVL